jgi:hypothetical protein
MNTSNSDKTIITSGVFIITFMFADALLSGEYDKVPREIVGGILLIFMLTTFQFIGLARLAGPFAVLIAGTVFLTRGNRIYTRLAEFAKTDRGNTSNGGNGSGGIRSGYVSAPEYAGQ